MEGLRGMETAKRVLKVHTLKMTPYVECLMNNKKTPLKCGRPGDHQHLFGYSSSSQIFMEFLNEIKQPFEFVIVDHKSSGTKYFNTTSNQTLWNEDYALGLLQNGIIDTSRYSFIQTAERQEDFEFSYPVRFIKTGFVFKSPDFVGSSNILTQAFTSHFWIALICTAIMILASMTLHCYVHLQNPIDVKKTFIQSINMSFWEMVSMLTGTKFDANSMKTIEKCSKISFRITLGLFHILVLFILSLYGSSLLATILLESPPAFQSTSELATLVKNKQKTVAYSSLSYLSHMKSASTTKSLQEMEKAIEKNPAHRIESNTRKVAEYLMQHPNVVLVGSSAEKSRIIASQICGLTYGDDKDIDALVTTTAYIFRKKDPILTALNSWLIRRGPYPRNVIEAAMKVDGHIGPDSSCKKPLPGDPLGFSRLIAVFYLSVVWCSIGCVSLLCEIFINRKKAKREEQRKVSSPGSTVSSQIYKSYKNIS